MQKQADYVVIGGFQQAEQKRLKCFQTDDGKEEIRHL